MIELAGAEVRLLVWLWDHRRSVSGVQGIPHAFDENGTDCGQVKRAALGLTRHGFLGQRLGVGIGLNPKGQMAAFREMNRSMPREPRELVEKARGAGPALQKNGLTAGHTAQAPGVEIENTTPPVGVGSCVRETDGARATPALPRVAATSLSTGGAFACRRHKITGCPTCAELADLDVRHGQQLRKAAAA